MLISYVAIIAIVFCLYDMADQRTISEGDHVVFKTDDKTKVFQVVRKRAIFFEKSKLKGEELLGQKYGTLFEVQHGRLVAATAPVKAAAIESSAVPEGSGKDNRDLVASGENQKLSQEDILKMKEEGLTGQDIVGKLVQQSETFKTKTEFSQEKYIKKKKKKYMLMFRVLHPSSGLLLDTFKQNASKICNLRADTLSQLLCYSNVMSGSTVAVVESCQGLVLGSVMERLGGRGRVLHLYPGNDMNRHVVKDFNFSEDHLKILHDFPLNKLASLENGTLLSTVDPTTRSTTCADGSDRKDDTSELPSHQTKQQTADSNGATSVSADVMMDVDDKDNAGDEGVEGGNEDVCGDDSDDGGNSGDEGKLAGDGKGGKRRKSLKVKSPQSRTQLEAKKQQKYEKLREAASILQERNLDSLIIATKYDPVALLLRLLPYVAPSRPVVVFSQHKEPLVDCFTQVKENSFGVQLRLSESWYREYQVLPSRTHPLMSMSGTGGYLLSFIRVVSHQ